MSLIKYGVSISLSLLLVSLPMIANLSFYPSKETLQRITSIVLKKQKGAFIQLGDDDLNMALSSADHQYKQGIQELFGCEDSNFFKSFPLRCKGTATELGCDTAQVSHDCKQLRGSVVPLLNNHTPDVYAPKPIEALARHDIHYAARFLRLLRSIGTCLYVGERKFSEEQRTLLFGPDHFFISIEDMPEIDSLENQCGVHIGKSSYTVIFINGLIGHSLARRLWKKYPNIYIFDIGDFGHSLFSNAPAAYDKEALIRALSREIRILYTAALIPHYADMRRGEYIKSIEILNNYWYQPDIVEACINTASYLEAHCNNVFHSNVNNAHLKNKGVNEARSIQQAFNHYKFGANDLIVKLTGRYHFKSDMFLRVIEDTPDVDGYVTIDPRTHFSFSGCFGLRYHYFKDMIDNIDLASMEYHMIDFERVVLEYMKKIEKEQNARIIYLEQVDIIAFVNHLWLYHW